MRLMLHHSQLLAGHVGPLRFFFSGSATSYVPISLFPFLSLQFLFPFLFSTLRRWLKIVLDRIYLTNNFLSGAKAPPSFAPHRRGLPAGLPPFAGRRSWCFVLSDRQTSNIKRLHGQTIQEGLLLASEKVR